MSHPTVVRCVLFITSSHYHLHQLGASKAWRDTSPGNRNTKYRSIKHFPCLPSTPSGPYADWRGFTMILSRDFNTIHTRIILSFSIQIQTFFVSSSRRVQEKIPDRWPLAHSGLWNTIGETENYTIRRQYNTTSHLHLYWQSLIVSRKRKFQFNFSTWLPGGIVNWSKKCPLAILWQLPIANRIQQNSG